MVGEHHVIHSHVSPRALALVDDLQASLGAFPFPDVPYGFQHGVVAPSGGREDGFAINQEVDAGFLPIIRESAREGGVDNVASILGEFEDPKLSRRDVDVAFIHDVLHHEIGHYFYKLPDRYATGSSNPDYYQGVTGSDTTFTVTVNTGDPNTVMSSNFPHKFVDTTNASITV